MKSNGAKTIDTINIYPQEHERCGYVNFSGVPYVSLFYRDGKRIGHIDYNPDGSVKKYSFVDGLLSAEDEKALEVAAPNDAAKITEVLRRYTRCPPPGFVTFG